MNDQPTEAKPRYFIDARVGCIAVRDRLNTDPDYPGLHSDTDGVAWYKHGRRDGALWGVAPEHAEEAKVVCDRMNAETPEQPKPVTPESLADEYASQFAVMLSKRTRRATSREDFIAGYRANTERNADIAQRLSLAEEALQRNGFEPGVVNDVPTWVPTKAAVGCYAGAKLVEKLETEAQRLRRELNHVGFYCAGTEFHHVSDYVLRALGKSGPLVRTRDDARVGRVRRKEERDTLQSERDDLRRQLAEAKKLIQARLETYHRLCDEHAKGLKIRDEALATVEAMKEAAARRSRNFARWLLGETEAGA